MHYYKRNIGDYAKKAGRLSMLQHGSYTLLIDACYDREIFPTLEQAIEWTWASSTEEIEAVKFVLSKFFILGSDGVYVQDRILQELVEYHGKADTNKRIAIERETKRKENSTNRAQVVNEPPPNQEPLTNNHKPVLKTKAAPLNFYEADAQVVADFVKQRKTKPTQTAIEAIKSKAEGAGYTLEAALKICCERGWQGFNPDWVKGNSFAKPSAHTGFEKTNYMEGVAADGSF